MKLFLLGILIAISACILDLYTKITVFSRLEEFAIANQIFNPQIKIFDFFSLVYVWNRGISFGMFNHIQNSQMIFAAMQSAIAAVVFIWLCFNKKPHFSVALGLIIGGALGNVIDRLKNGAVADFLDFHIGSYHWPAFNLADSFVFIGVMIIVFDELFLRKKK